jgi:formylglycine-generating enzyme
MSVIKDSHITQGLYQKVMGKNPSPFKGVNLPVVMVSWYDAVAFANKLSKMEGREMCYEINGKDVQWTNKDCKGWRLPTEAEWEYAARGGENFKYAGSNNADEVAWFAENSMDKIHNVGQKKANGYGLYDMSGNVYEWVWDWYEDYQKDSLTNPQGGLNGSYRVLRGGSCYDYPRELRVYRRDLYIPTRRGQDGFRLGRSF